MKLAPMKRLEDKANTSPLMLSEDIPLYVESMPASQSPSKSHRRLVALAVPCAKIHARATHRHSPVIDIVLIADGAPN